MAKALARSEKEGFVIVTFFYGAGLSTQSKYTDWDQSVQGATSEPRMELAIPENTATFDKRELRVVLPQDSFTTRLSSGVPHSPVYVEIEELTQGLFTGDQASQKVLYSGKATHVTRNFQGQNGKVALFFLPAKSRLDVPMGLPCNHHCAWALFRGGCGVTPVSVTGAIASRNGSEITVNTLGVTTPGAADARYWKRGYAEKDGLVITIRDYDGSVDPTKLYMADVVPSDWVGGVNDITFVPGCDKTIETCRVRWNGEQFFMGLGYSIPEYSPNYESPQ